MADNSNRYVNWVDGQLVYRDPPAWPPRKKSLAAVELRVKLDALLKAEGKKQTRQLHADQ